MNILTINELHPTAQKFVTNNGLEQYLDGDHDLMSVEHPDAMALASSIVSLIPLSDRIKKGFLTGYDKTIKSDGEYHNSDYNGIQTQYDGYKIQNAILFADRYLKGETRIEIGLKYPVFSVSRFKKLFAVGEPVRMLNYKSSGGEEYFYDVFTDEKGNVFTFQPDGIGKGGYAGAVFANETEAFKFLDFLFGSKAHYLKDLEIGINGLSGWGIEEVDERLNK